MEKRQSPLKKIRRLEAGYTATIGMLILMVVGTPFWVHRWLALTSERLIVQNTLEALLIAVLLGLAYAISRIYRNLLNAYRQELQRLDMNNTRLQERLTDAFKYIGKVNVEIQEIRSVFSLPSRLPQSRRELKNLLEALARKALTIANTHWVAIRIIECSSLRTVIEHLESRGDGIPAAPQIGNKPLVEGEPIAGLSWVRSDGKAQEVTAACIFPREALNWEEKLLLEAITGEIELLFLTFTAVHSRGINRAAAPIPRQASAGQRNA